MSILTDQLPTAIEIGGREYEIDTDFRTCLRVIMAFEDPELAVVEKQAVLVTNLYPVPPPDFETAYREGVRFLNLGKHAEEGDGDDPGPRLYSFSQDAGLIFAAFRQTHGLDLSTAKLHWWVFQSLFMDLGGDTAFCNLVSLRRRVKTGKATKEERQAARDLGEVFDLPEPDDRTLEEREREAEFMRLLGGGGK